MHALMERLFPLCRSITGAGVRETLDILKTYIALDITEVPSGTQVLDWTVPKEWNIRDAYVRGPDGRKIIDFHASNLHVVSYSVPVHARMTLEELRPHLHTLPDQPDLIPYRTSYYHETWGFCLPHRQYEQLPDGVYEVVIDSTLEDGFLTYGEFVVPGCVEEDVLVSCYVCHPSMCNDNLSGVVLTTMLAERVATWKPYYTYHFLFIPETIGAITWLAQNCERVERIAHGLVLTCVGDPGPLTYKRSRRGNAIIDRAATHVLAAEGYTHRVLDFAPLGSDERQFCSPGFDLPMGSLMRTPYKQFPEYHTSADDLDFVTPEALAASLAASEAIFEVLEGNRTYINMQPYGEPQLGRRGLYRSLGGAPRLEEVQEALMWVLNFSDGDHDLLAIAERSGLPFRTIQAAATLLLEHHLVEVANAPEPETLPRP